MNTAVLQTVATASNAMAAGDLSTYETVCSGLSSEQAEYLISMVEQLLELQGYVSGFFLFVILVIILYLSYKFFNMFF